jgi:DDE family transposase
LGGDKNYDTRDFVDTLREMKITPHVAKNEKRGGGSSALDARTTRYPGYEISQQKRKRVEHSFGWINMIGLLRNVKLRGIRKVSCWFTFVGSAYNLIRLRRLRAEAAAWGNAKTNRLERSRRAVIGASDPHRTPFLSHFELSKVRLEYENRCQIEYFNELLTKLS